METVSFCCHNSNDTSESAAYDDDDIETMMMQIFKDLSRVKRFNAEEAMEYGLIDKIVRPPRIKADAPRQDETSGLG